MRTANSVAAWCLYSTCTNSRVQWLHDTGRISLESSLGEKWKQTPDLVTAQRAERSQETTKISPLLNETQF